jgi:hypothetical protein
MAGHSDDRKMETNLSRRSSRSWHHPCPQLLQSWHLLRMMRVSMRNARNEQREQAAKHTPVSAGLGAFTTRSSRALISFSSPRTCTDTAAQRSHRPYTTA